MHPVETYLTHLARIHSTGAAVAETSHYAALENLLDEIGKKLRNSIKIAHKSVIPTGGRNLERIRA